MINRNFPTLDEFTIRQYRKIPNATGELSTLLRDISLAAKRINVEVNKAGVADVIGDAIAKGMALNGTQRIFDIQPSNIHQRVPIFIGSKNLVEECLSCIAGISCKVEV